jgi:hypothetical protein
MGHATWLGIQKNRWGLKGSHPTDASTHPQIARFQHASFRIVDSRGRNVGVWPWCKVGGGSGLVKLQQSDRTIWRPTFAAAEAVRIEEGEAGMATWRSSVRLVYQVNH